MTCSVLKMRKTFQWTSYVYITVRCFSESSDMSSHFIAVVDAKVNIILIHSPKTILWYAVYYLYSIKLRMYQHDFETTIHSWLFDDGDRWQSS